MDLLQNYQNDGELHQNSTSFPDSSPPRLLPSKSAAPLVDDTMLALTVANQTLSKPIDPVQYAVAFNPTYDQLWAPVLGSAHPYAKDGIAQGMRNHKLGFVEDAAIDSFVFDEQYNTFHKYGYAADPSASEDMNDLEIVEATKSSKGVGVVSTTFDSDTNSSQRVTTVLLNGFNYLPWSRAVTIALGGRSRLGFINGKDKAPDSNSSDFENWLAKDQMVMSWILNSMERNIAEIFSYYQSSLELWEAVKDMYGNQNNSARIFQIQQDIAKLHQNGQPFVNLLRRLKSLWNELEVYRPHSVDPTVLRNRTEEDQIFQLLASLGSEFEDLRSHILITNELPSLKSVCSTIQREEIRRKVMTRDSSVNISEGRAFAAHQRDQSAEKKFFKGKRPDLKCEFCNLIGHSQDRCWSLHPQLKPKSFKDKLGGNQKRFPTHRAHLAAQATDSIPSSPMSLLNEFASFLQGKHNFGGDGAGNDEPTALLSKFAGLSTGGNSEHFQGPLHQTEDW